MEKKTSATTIVLCVALGCSIVCNILLWKGMPVTPPVSDCFKTDGFETSKTISGDEFTRFAESYNETLTDPDSIKGGIISRSAFDEFLCVKECNAISYTFGRDPDGTTGPGGKGVFIMFTGLNVTLDPETRKFIYRDLGISKYVPGHWCPPTCNPY